MFLVKLLGVTAIMVSYAMFMPLLRLFMSQHKLFEVSRWVSVLGLKVLGGRLRCVRPPIDLKPSALYVVNHASYVDVLVIMSQINGSFVTSIEIKQTPGLGLLCKVGGCSFTERRSIWNLPQEVADLTKMLEAGYNVILFPEGTTTPGTYLREFKSSLIEAAARAGRPIVPAFINYTAVNGRKPLLEDRDYVCWYGTMDFVPHIIRLCTLKSIDVEIGFLDPIDVSPKGDRKAKSKLARAKIAEEFRPMCEPG
jgi:lyso-ornithine lipid O-acyltransferase